MAAKPVCALGSLEYGGNKWLHSHHLEVPREGKGATEPLLCGALQGFVQEGIATHVPLVALPWVQ